MDRSDWDARYRHLPKSQSPSLWPAQPVQAFRNTIEPLIDPGTALDIATGDGRNAIWLAQHGWAVTGIDFSTEGLSIAKTRALSAQVGVEWIHDDATSWNPGRQFDLVTMSYLHLDSPSANIELISRVGSWLAPGGTLFVVGHDRRNLTTAAPASQPPESLYTADILRRAASDLHVVSARQVARHTATDPEAFGDVDVIVIDTVLHAVNRY